MRGGTVWGAVDAALADAATLERPTAHDGYADGRAALPHELAWLGWLPTLNATLNGIAAVLLTTGYLFVRRRHIDAHRACMLAALATSALFLASYLTYHALAGSTPFTAGGWVRPVYFSVLISHVVLAATVVPLALVTVWRALRGRFEAHARLARWTLPIWLYVSVTGVVVYLMLYHLYPAP